MARVICDGLKGRNVIAQGAGSSRAGALGRVATKMEALKGRYTTATLKGFDQLATLKDYALHVPIVKAL